MSHHTTSLALTIRLYLYRLQTSLLQNPLFKCYNNGYTSYNIIINYVYIRRLGVLNTAYRYKIVSCRKTPIVTVQVKCE